MADKVPEHQAPRVGPKSRRNLGRKGPGAKGSTQRPDKRARTSVEKVPEHRAPHIGPISGQKPWPDRSRSTRLHASVRKADENLGRQGSGTHGSTHRSDERTEPLAERAPDQKIPRDGQKGGEKAWLKRFRGRETQHVGQKGGQKDCPGGLRITWLHASVGKTDMGLGRESSGAEGATRRSDKRTKPWPRELRSTRLHASAR